MACGRQGGSDNVTTKTSASLKTHGPDPQLG